MERKFQDIGRKNKCYFCVLKGKRLSQVLSFVQKFYPEFNFKSTSLKYKKSQFLLKTSLQQIFPGEGIEMGFGHW